jgi:hypothetical protein
VVRRIDLPLHPLSSRAGVRRDKRKGSEKFLKKTFESFGGLKKMIYLCTTFRSEKNGRNRTKRESFFIAILRTAFFEVIEQLNSFSTLFGE